MSTLANSSLAFIVHGLGGHRKQPHIRCMAESLHVAGYTVVTRDATNSLGESGGRYRDAITSGYYQDFQEVVQWASQQSWYREPFLVGGHSIGGLCSILYAQEHPEKVYAVVAVSSVIHGQRFQDGISDDVLKQRKQQGSAALLIKADDGSVPELGRRFMDDIVQYDMTVRAYEMTMPVCVIVGDRDRGVPVSHQRLFLEKLPRIPSNKLIIMDDCGHSIKIEKDIQQLKKGITGRINDIQYIE